MTIDDEMLMAYADGELGSEARQAVDQALAADALLRERLETQRRLRASLTGHYGPVASEPVPDRLLAMLGAEPAPSDVPSLAAARARRQAPRTQSWFNWGAIAASLAVGVLGGQMLREQGPVGSQDGMLVAQGRLAADLDSRLASAQAGDTRIGLTFADREGRVCRTFDASELSGLACRTGGSWNLVTTAAPAGQSTQYRQAGSAAVMETAQRIMAGEPMDAADEKAAMEAGWQLSATPGD